MIQVNSYGYSFIGRRKNNEDSFIIRELSPEFSIYAIADGMGGAIAGEIASSLALEVMVNFLGKEIKSDSDYSDQEISDFLKKGFEKVQKAISEEIIKNPEYSGMGTTLVVLLKAKDKWVCANIGDSRLYMLLEDKIQPVTKDHSLLQQYIDSNDHLPDEEWLLKYSSYLTKAVDGSNTEPDIYFLEEINAEFGSGICFLLCSDGLLTKTNVKQDEDIHRIILESEDIRDSAEQLISNAFYNGSADNITVILIETPGFKRDPIIKNKLPFPPVLNSLTDSPYRKRGWLFYFLISAIFICLLSIFLIISISHPFRKSIRNIDRNTLLINELSKDSKSVLQDHLLKNWNPFNPDEYRLPLNDSSMIIWTPIYDSSHVSSYIICINKQNVRLDSIRISPGNNFIRIGYLKKLKSGNEYQVEIKAIMRDGTVYEGNKFNFIYH